MKNIIKKTFIFLLLASLVMFGCKKSYLDVSPKGIITQGTFYTSSTAIDQAVTAVYGILNTIQTWDLYLLANMGSIASDDAVAGGFGPGDVAEYYALDYFTFIPNSPNILINPWGTLYKSVFLANLAIENIPKAAKIDTSQPQSFYDQRMGEAKFLRALDYFYLVQVYGEVPLVSHVLSSTEYTMGRSSLRSVFDLIESDLTYAASVLPATPKSTKDIGRATSGAAQGLLAKVYLFESSYAHYYPNDKYSAVVGMEGQSRFAGLKERWSDAQAMADNVISSGTYKLVGIDGERYHSWRDGTSTTIMNTDGFRFIWTTDGNNSKESVFEIQCEDNGAGWMSTRGSSMVNWTGTRWYHQGTDIKESSYWGFNQPSYELLAEFNKEPGDPRFNVTIHKDTVGGNDSLSTDQGWSKIAYDDFIHSSTWFTTTNMFQAKYECSYAEYRGNALQYSWAGAPFNTRVLRYSDIVLVAAEAAIMAGDNAHALTYINMVRTRARMCGSSGNTVPANLSGTVTMDQLIHERRLELALEGHRFYDLVRWNLAVSKLNGLVLPVVNQTISFSSPKNDFYPLPSSQVDLSGGALKQYPGW